MVTDNTMTTKQNNESKTSSKQTSTPSDTSSEAFRQMEAEMRNFANEKKREYRSNQDILHSLVEALRREGSELGGKLTSKQLEALGWVDDHLRDNRLKSLERAIQTKLMDFIYPIKGLEEEDASIAEFYFAVDPAMGAFYQLTIVVPQKFVGRMDEFGKSICDEFRVDHGERLFFGCGGV